MPRSIRNWLLQGLALIGGVVAILFFGWLHFGSIGAFAAKIQGYSLYSPPATVARRDVEAGRNIKIPFTLQNLSTNKIHVYRLTDTCSCAVEGIPSDLESGELKHLSLVLPAREMTADFAIQLEYLPASKPVYLRVQVE
jgi:hypothetical protein